MLALVLAIVMVISMFAACGSKEDPAATTEATTVASTTEATTTNGSTDASTTEATTEAAQ